MERARCTMEHPTGRGRGCGVPLHTQEETGLVQKGDRGMLWLKAGATSVERIGHYLDLVCLIHGLVACAVEPGRELGDEAAAA